jgi:hypothetical protein
MIKSEAKKTWESAGLNKQGAAAVNSWIDTLIDNIEANPGRFDAYKKFAYYKGSDPMGSVHLLKGAVDQTSK